MVLAKIVIMNKSVALANTKHEHVYGMGNFEPFGDNKKGASNEIVRWYGTVQTNHLLNFVNQWSMKVKYLLHKALNLPFNCASQCQCCKPLSHRWKPINACMTSSDTLFQHVGQFATRHIVTILWRVSGAHVGMGRSFQSSVLHGDFQPITFWCWRMENLHRNADMMDRADGSLPTSVFHHTCHIVLLSTIWLLGVQWHQHGLAALCIWSNQDSSSSGVIETQELYLWMWI